MNDDAGETWRREVDVTAGPDGAVTDTFDLPEWFVATYSVTATGLFSGVATSSFTDSALTVKAGALGTTASNSITFTLNWAGYNDSACTSADTQAGSGQIVNVNANAGATVPKNANYYKLTAAVTSTSPSGRAFISWTNGQTTVPGNPICVQNATATYTANYDRAPVVAVSTPPAAVSEGQAASASGTWSDADASDTVTLTASLGTVTKNVNGTWSWSYTPPDGPLTPTVTVTANDGAVTSTTSFTVTVNNVTPTVTPPADQTATPNVTTSFMLGTFADPGADSPWSVTVVWGDGSANTTFTASTVGTITAQSHKYTTGGLFTVTVTVKDSDNATSSPATFHVSTDSTAPTVTVNPSRSTDANGWYNHSLTLTMSGSDSGSGIQSCSAPQVYSGPDGSSRTVTGTCTDNAGNTGSASFTFKYDATAPAVTATPSRGSDSNGWYNHALSVSFGGTDATSGGVTCEATKSYGGPDTASASVSGNCLDAAGNTGSASFGFEYDGTAPAVTATASRAPDSGGWYNHAFSVSFGGVDALSDAVSCDAAKSYGGPDTQSSSLVGFCTDAAGNSASAAYAFKYDATAPAVTAHPSRGADSNDWYDRPFSVTFDATDATSFTCDPAQTFGGPDSASASISGTCTDAAGNTGSAQFSFKYDATAPSVTATPDRSPNAYGWYREPLTATFTATDDLSGVVHCDAPATYAGPDASSAALDGVCLDATTAP